MNDFGEIFYMVMVIVIIFAIFAIPIMLIKENATQPEDINQTTLEDSNQASHEHEWVTIAVEAESLVETGELLNVASEGTPVVYLTRYRKDPRKPEQDVYVAYDQQFKEITVYQSEGNIAVEIEYISEGVPHYEKYEHGQPVCKICGAKLVHGGKVTYYQYTYKFYIPEGTLFVWWE